MEEKLRKCIEEQRQRGFTYSMDLVEEVYQLLLQGKRRRTIARRLGVARSTVYNIVSAIMHCDGVPVRTRAKSKVVPVRTEPERHSVPVPTGTGTGQEPAGTEPTYMQDNPWLAILQKTRNRK